MKSNHIQFLAVMIFVLGMSVTGWSQSTGLKVLSMPGFPVVPQDTAYEGQSYAFSVILVNNTGSVINTPVDIQFQVDSITNIAFTVAQPALGINDTATFLISGYTFNQPQFKMGNNIVVVWPSINGLSIPVDTFYADVYFVPLSSLGNNDLNYNTISLFPNPAQQFLQLNLNPNDKVGYVRIFDLNGKTIIDLTSNLNHPIDISQLCRGTYLFETEINGRVLRRKFIRN
ncbi:MAG TPA: T9SS type A sorting domain-containing protein [Bacteroidia bacterium]|nr:T9SS type A sorting domain-containing protein [Bacteroidia bacterium]